MPDSRIPNPLSPEEVRRAFAALGRKGNIITQGAIGEVLVGTAVGSLPAWGTELTMLTKLTVDNITIDAATILSDTGAISFGNENLSTTGTIGGVNVTSGVDPGHTHSAYQPVDADLTAIAALSATGGWAKRTGADTWEISTPSAADVGADASGTAAAAVGSHESTYNHGNFNTAYGWGDHSGLYDVDGTAAAAVGSHESTFNHANYDTAYGWGDHAGMYDPAGTAAAAVSTHESTYNHANFVTAYNWGDHASGGYLKANGTVPLTGDWTTGVFSIIGSDHWYMRADNKRMYFGAGNDVWLYFNGTSLIFDAAGGCYFYNSNLGLGVAPDARRQFHSRWLTEFTANHIWGFEAELFYGSAGSGNMAKSVVAFNLYLRSESDWDGNSTNVFTAIQGTVTHAGSGSLISANGMNLSVNIASGGGDITSARGLNIIFAKNEPTSSFTNIFGLYINHVNQGTTLNYAIYTNDGIIYFADSVGIGVKPPGEKLQVAGNIFVTDNLASIYGTGKDAKIYYNAADLVIEPNATGSGAVKIIGDMYFGGAGSGMVYGGISAYDVDDTIDLIAGIANKVQITSFDTNDPSNLTTPAHGTGDITITKAGDYFVSVCMHVESDAGLARQVGFGVYKNDGDTLFQNLHAHQDFAGGGGETHAVSLNGIATFAEGDTIEIWAWNEAGISDIIIDDITFSIVQVGGD